MFVLMLQERTLMIATFILSQETRLKLCVAGIASTGTLKHGSAITIPPFEKWRILSDEERERLLSDDNERYPNSTTISTSNSTSISNSNSTSISNSKDNKENMADKPRRHRINTFQSLIIMDWNGICSLQMISAHTENERTVTWYEKCRHH